MFIIGIQVCSSSLRICKKDCNILVIFLACYVYAGDPGLFVCCPLWHGLSIYIKKCVNCLWFLDSSKSKISVDNESDDLSINGVAIAINENASDCIWCC